MLRLDLDCFIHDPRCRNSLFDFHVKDNRFHIQKTLISSCHICKDSDGINIKDYDDVDKNEKNFHWERRSESSPYVGSIIVNKNEFKLQCPLGQNWIYINDIYSVDDFGFILHEGDIMLFGSVKFKIMEIKALSYGDPKNKINKEQEDYDKEVMSQESKSLQSTPNTKPICRVCLSTSDYETNPLVNPCKCIGSVQFLHLQCLKQWLKSKIEVKDYDFITLISYSQFECELCKSLIPTKVKYQSKIINFLEYDKPYKNYVILQNIPNEIIDKTYIYIINFDEKSIVTLGRGKTVDISMQDASVSREHAKIELINNTFYLKDFKSKFGTLINLQYDIVFLPNKIFSIYHNKCYYKFCLKKTCIASLKCYKTKFFQWEDYNIFLKKIIIENDSKKTSIIDGKGSDIDSNNNQHKMQFTSDIIKKNKEQLKGISNKKDEGMCINNNNDNNNNKHDNIKNNQEAPTNRDIPNSTGRELIDENQYLQMSHLSQLNLMKQTHNNNDEDEDENDESNSDNLSLAKDIMKEIKRRHTDDNDNTRNEDNDIGKKITIDEIQKAPTNDHKGKKYSLKETSNNASEDLNNISKSSIKTIKKELLNNDENENKQTFNVINEHREKILNKPKIIPSIINKDLVIIKQQQLPTIIVEDKNESCLSIDLHIINNNCHDDEEGGDSSSRKNTNPIILPQENIPSQIPNNLSHTPINELLNKNNFFSRKKDSNKYKEKDKEIFSVNSQLKNITGIDHQDTLKINEEIEKLTSTTNKNKPSKAIISKEDLINTLFITEQNDIKSHKRQSDATIRSLVQQLFDGDRKQNDMINENHIKDIDKSIENSNNQSSRTQKKKNEKPKEKETIEIVNSLFEN